jgi:hypothetical protein
MKKMWLFLALVSILVGLSAAQTAKTNPKVPQISIAVTATNKPAKAGSGIVIVVALTNVSAQVAALPSAAGRENQWYTVDVHHQDGSMVTAIQHRSAKAPPLPPGEVIVDVYSIATLELKSGETVKGTVVISDSYDLTQPGKYLVQARCGTVCGGVKSNTIALTIAP